MDYRNIHQGPVQATATEHKLSPEERKEIRKALKDALHSIEFLKRLTLVLALVAVFLILFLVNIVWG